MDQKKILRALQAIRFEFGPEADRYINIGELFRVQPLMKNLRVKKEVDISRQYIPGWRFEDSNHFRYMMKTGGFRFQGFDRTKEIQFGDLWWIRSILVPSKQHYFSELASCLRGQFEWERDNELPTELRRHDLGWTSILGRILAQETLAGELSYSKKPNRHHSVTSDSMFRWARSAERYRKERESSVTPSRWRIVRVELSKNELHEPERTKTSLDLLDTGYWECWEWSGDPSIDSPARLSLTFDIPAGPHTWKRPWRRYTPNK